MNLGLQGFSRRALLSAIDRYINKGGLLVGTGGSDKAAQLPVGADTYVLQADSTQTLGVKWAAAGGGGAAIGTGALGSEPGSPTTGDLYLPNNSFKIERYDGAAWQAWGPIWPMGKVPTIGTRSTTVMGWFNQGSATATTTNGGVSLIDPGTTRHLRGLTLTCPSTPYTKTALMLPIWNAGVGAAYLGWGMCWSDGTGFHTLQMFVKDVATSPLAVARFSAENTFGSWDVAGFSNFGAMIPANSPIWMQLRDDGTNRHFSISFDGYNFLDVYSVTRTTFITPTQVGVFIDNETTIANMGATLLSWA